MDSALLVGGTRFIGRQTVEELLAHDYDVTLLTRGEHDNPFGDDDRVNHFRGDRNERAALERAVEVADPDLVVDFVVLFPEQARVAVDVFADAEAYVYVSSGSVYAGTGPGPGLPEIPVREDESALEPCSEAQATDDSKQTYGARKAECDRIVTGAATDDLRAISVRPMLVYGPHDYTERLDYWLARVEEHDAILVPGDGDSVFHRAYVEDVASALRLAGERGNPGEAYNVADRNATTIDTLLELADDELDTTVDLVHASERELEREGLSMMDFPHVLPTPAIASTAKLHALGWESTPLDDAMAWTIEEHHESDRDGSDAGPSRNRTAALIDRLTTGD